MCKTRVHNEHLCGHDCTWIEITYPCGPFRGFSTCTLFADGWSRSEPDIVESYNVNECPQHGALDGVYNRNYIRMVDHVREGWACAVKEKEVKRKRKKERHVRYGTVERESEVEWVMCAVM